MLILPRKNKKDWLSSILALTESPYRKVSCSSQIRTDFIALCTWPLFHSFNLCKRCSSIQIQIQHVWFHRFGPLTKLYSTWPVKPLSKTNSKNSHQNKNYFNKKRQSSWRMKFKNWSKKPSLRKMRPNKCSFICNN